jgi:hypothetical protein
MFSFFVIEISAVAEQVISLQHSVMYHCLSAEVSDSVAEPYSQPLLHSFMVRAGRH